MIKITTYHKLPLTALFITFDRCRINQMVVFIHTKLKGYAVDMFIKKTILKLHSGTRF